MVFLTSSKPTTLYATDMGETLTGNNQLPALEDSVNQIVEAATGIDRDYIPGDRLMCDYGNEGGVQETAAVVVKPDGLVSLVRRGEQGNYLGILAPGGVPRRWLIYAEGAGMPDPDPEAGAAWMTDELSRFAGSMHSGDCQVVPATDRVLVRRQGVRLPSGMRRILPAA